jgi:hypothetical protein
MKKNHLIVLALVAICSVFVVKLLGAESQGSSPRYEYATIRWAGPENTHIIRPGGQVEFIGGELRKVQKPDRADNRSFYMNAAMNGLTKEGYELAGMSNDDIVMKKSVPR